MKIDTGLKACKNYEKFLFRFKIKNKSYRKTFDYPNKSWDKRTRISKARIDAFNYKKKIKSVHINSSLNEYTKLDEFIHNGSQLLL
ncbi:hypothetical protein CRV00_05725 [Malaciobacter molluscorum]|uniref:hypothetical protein n=1 Tax=Malaciobacter molluscorum TaxID=1032072 RepID=UPI00100AC9E8|nr:hypothetical protein [Malaciobacter molluscorum]RXJ94830.1 hypothetical protein CRV00_05725 [Malaciobacter molluscorum]